MAFSNKTKALIATFMILFSIIVYVANAKETVPEPGTPVTASMQKNSVAPYPEGLGNYHILTIKFSERKKFFAQSNNTVDGAYKVPAFVSALRLVPGKAFELASGAPLIAVSVPNTETFGFTSSGILRPFPADDSLQKQPEVTVPNMFSAVPFKFSNDFGGNSAGLAVALMWYEILTPGDLSAGKTIYASGEIDTSGKIGDVAYINEKVDSALKANADIVLVPTSYAGPEDPKIIKVGTLKQAVDAIRDSSSR